MLTLGFAALPARALLLALVTDPAALVLVQMLDGLSSAMFGVMLPLIAADLTVGTNRFNLCIGTLSLAMGIGAALSTLMAGDIAQAFTPGVAFVVLGFAGIAATLLVLLAMPETRPVLPAATLDA